jgi:dTDP-4-amino-4,6-dideoxygalactose transaminase
MNTIPVIAPWPQFEPDEVLAAMSVLQSGRVNYWTGEENRAFEREWADFVGTKHAIALANGTVALDLALFALGIGSGDDVLVTPRSYVASASSVAMCGARPVFADVDPDSQNVTVATLRAALTPATRAIVVVHLAGWPCDMPAIMDFAREHKLKVIEDCAQAHNATIAVEKQDQQVGSFGDIGCFSFCQDKIMTTGGEGGMLVTNDDALWRAAWSHKDHGKSYERVFNEHHPPGFRWLIESFGTNLRLTEMQAAIGRVQLRKLAQWSEARRRNASVLRTALSALPWLRVPWPADDRRHAAYRLYAFVRPERLPKGWDRDRLMSAINASGVPCFVGGCPEIYREKAFVEGGLAPLERLPVARQLGETSMSFLVHPTLSEQAIRECAATLTRVLSDIPGA